MSKMNCESCSENSRDSMESRDMAERREMMRQREMMNQRNTRMQKNHMEQRNMMNSRTRMEQRNRMECNDCGAEFDTLQGMPLAMAYVPWQKFECTYEPAQALQAGTIFPELDKPFYGRRGNRS